MLKLVGPSSRTRTIESLAPFAVDRRYRTSASRPKLVGSRRPGGLNYRERWYAVGVWPVRRAKVVLNALGVAHP